MLLEADNKEEPLIMKQACAIPSNNHITFGLFHFLVHGRKKVSYTTHESANVDTDGKSNIKMHMTLVKKYLDCASLNITPPSDRHVMSSVSQHKHEYYCISLN